MRACAEKYVKACVRRKFDFIFFIDNKTLRNTSAVVVNGDEFELIVADA